MLNLDEILRTVVSQVRQGRGAADGRAARLTWMESNRALIMDHG